MKNELFLSSISLIIKNENNEILLQKRNNTKLWPNRIALPAGHIDEGENAYEAAIREAKEELGIDISKEDIIDTFVVSRKNKNLSPYYDIYFEIEKYQGKLTINEPDKCSKLMWCNINDLPEYMLEFEKVAIDNNSKGIKFSVISTNEDGSIIE